MEHAKEHHVLMPRIPGRSEFSMYSARSAIIFSHALTFPLTPWFTSSPSHFRLHCRPFKEGWVLGHVMQEKSIVTLMDKAQQVSSRPYTWFPWQQSFVSKLFCWVRARQRCWSHAELFQDLTEQSLGKMPCFSTCQLRNGIAAFEEEWRHPVAMYVDNSWIICIKRGFG